MKDKFDNALMRHDLMRNEPEETMEQLIEARDEFAIKFAVWLDKNKKEHKKIVLIEMLLDLFKKENPTL